MNILKNIINFFKVMLKPTPSDHCLDTIRLIKVSTDTGTSYIGGPNHVFSFSGLCTYLEWEFYLERYSRLINVRRADVNSDLVSFYFEIDLVYVSDSDIDTFNQLAISDWVTDSNVVMVGTPIKKTRSPFVAVGNGYFIRNK